MASSTTLCKPKKVNNLNQVSIEYIHKGRNMAFERRAPARSFALPARFRVTLLRSSHASSFDGSPCGFYLKLLFWNLMLAVVGSLLVVVVEPAAAGSGIDHVTCLLASNGRSFSRCHASQVITYLNGIHVPNLFRLRCALHFCPWPVTACVIVWVVLICPVLSLTPPPPGLYL